MQLHFGQWNEKGKTSNILALDIAYLHRPKPSTGANQTFGYNMS